MKRSFCSDILIVHILIVVHYSYSFIRMLCIQQKNICVLGILMLWSPMSVCLIEDSVEQNLENMGTFLSGAGFPQPGDVPILNRKIFRGHRVGIREHPYIASIRRNIVHYLMATILSKNVLVTVAHPLINVPIMELSVVVGENYSDRGSIMNTVILVIIHEHFNRYTLKADIALLRLYEDLIFKASVKPIALVSPHSELNGNAGFVTGWGRCDNIGNELCLPRSSTYYRDEIIDPMLKTVKFNIVRPNYYCEGYERNRVPITPGMMCTGPAREENEVCPCLGVPGAPLVMRARLVGLASWGFGCGYSYDLPLVYTQISYYASWILTNIVIQRKINQENLTILYKATKGAFFLKWLKKTRIVTPLSLNWMNPVTQIVPLSIDKRLAYAPGSIYDVRDYVYDAKYRREKALLYEDYRKKIIEIKQLKLNHQFLTQPQKFLNEKYREFIQDFNPEPNPEPPSSGTSEADPDVIIKLPVDTPNYINDTVPICSEENNGLELD